MTRQQHAIYGLYIPDHPDAILYAGSWRVATLDKRLRQHREGKCRTTTKMAARDGVATGDLQMRVLAYWMSGVDPNPENEMTLGLQARGWCPWNSRYVFTRQDNQVGAHKQPREAKSRGARKLNETWGQTPEAHEARRRAASIGGRNQSREAKAAGGHIGGPIGGRKTQATWGKTPEAQEARRCGGRIGGRLTNCTRWHADRPKGDRLCAECAAKAALDNPSEPV